MSEHGSSAEDEFLKNGTEDSILSFILHLPVDYREVITLFYYHERKIREVAEMLGLSTNTVKTRLKRGRNLLRRMMEGNRDG